MPDRQMSHLAEYASYDTSACGPALARLDPGLAILVIKTTIYKIKLIGARYYLKGYEAYYGPLNNTEDYRSPRDHDGHGTHTTSTVGGRVKMGKDEITDLSVGKRKNVAVDMDTDKEDENMSKLYFPNVPIDQKPCIGMKFNSLKLAYDFYNAYARVSGFSIRKGSTWYNASLGHRKFICSKEGSRDKKWIDKDNAKREQKKLQDVGAWQNVIQKILMMPETDRLEMAAAARRRVGRNGSMAMAASFTTPLLLAATATATAMAVSFKGFMKTESGEREKRMGKEERLGWGKRKEGC
ncbi:hypothetical protein HHK36_031074 [Tetracentron sinense]|uniref:FAR1 domain-containing protein n=1 Tax=Tetracentron sinense TaxID=13715 RepID=A0A834YC76_TETSI|nr:hypothetical protein HHK36_031074 [Tetracentron sinense]